MKVTAKRIASFEKLIDKTEIKLLYRSNDVLVFVSSGHMAEETEAKMARLKKDDIQINRIKIALAKRRDLAPEHKGTFQDLYARCNEMSGQIQTSHKYLSDDAAKLQKEAETEKMDGIKVGTFIVGFPLALTASAKHYFGQEPISEIKWSTAGFLAAILIAFRHKAIPTIKDTAGFIYSLPKEVPNMFLVYYAKQTIKEKAVSAAKLFRNNHKATPKL